jgi:hypothetical protein
MPVWTQAVRDRTWIRVVLLALGRSVETSATRAAGAGEPSNRTCIACVNAMKQRQRLLRRGLHRLRPSLCDSFHQLLDRTRSGIGPGWFAWKSDLFTMDRSSSWESRRAV